MHVTNRCYLNALDTDKAIEIQHYAENRVKPSFGIGTHFTNDFPHVKPMNIVIKLVAVKITERLAIPIMHLQDIGG